MATAADVINRAARRVGILAREEALSSAEMIDYLVMLNDMLFGFGPKGIQYVHATLAQGTTINFPDEQVENVVLMMASKLLEEHPIPVSPDLRMAMANAKNELQAAYLVINPAVPDRALRRRRPGWFDFRNG